MTFKKVVAGGSKSKTSVKLDNGQNVIVNTGGASFETNPVVRVSSKHVDKKKEDTSRFWRFDIVAVTNLDTGRTIMRQVAGGSGIQGLTNEAVGLDYNMRDELGVYSEDTPIEVRSDISLKEKIMFSWSHPVRGDRMAFRAEVMGAISVLYIVKDIIVALLS